MKKNVLIAPVIIILVILTSATGSQEKEGWFIFNPSEKGGKAVTDMTDWIEKPAGKHGSVLIDGDRLTFEDGSVVKFWGTNVAGNLPFMKEDDAKRWASFLPKYGFNSVRFHKFTWRASDMVNSTVVTTERWKNFDFLCNELRKNGIYYGWSHIYGHKVFPGDSARVLAYSELAKTNFPWSHLNGTTSSLVNFAEDLQELNIELTVNMLNHVNPHTGLRYADDPALSFIEFQNEDNIFWSAIEATLRQTPSYKALLCNKFSNWLRAKYGNEESLRKAWNNEGISENESIESGNIYPQPNHGMFTYEYEQAVKEKRKIKQHVVDKAQFLYDEQLKFYRKFEMAVRKTGYKGPLVASCWQAGAGIAHLLNLKTDAEIGIVDRHNYFGGGQGHSMVPGKFSNDAMVSKIGSGLFGTGLQQVNNRPFALSEWMSLIPNEWTAESAPIIAAYGLGLQGWDASYVFATDITGYQPTIQSRGGGIYNANSPTQIALYPALSAMIYRQDVIEGATVVNRIISVESLLNGETPLSETVVQDYDRKSLTGQFRQNLMASGKVLITFGLENRLELNKKIPPPLEDGSIVSTTGQLTWNENGKGYFTINTSGTKALAGFAAGKELDLGDVVISTENEFAVIFITSLDRKKGINKSDKILITAVARARNTGMTFNASGTELLSTGRAPILLEPVNFTLRLKRPGDASLIILDHSGNPTENMVASLNGTWKIDGSATKSLYYLIDFQK
jgi:hypothetical protein